MTSGQVLILRALPWGADSRANRWGQIYASRSVIWGTWGSKEAEFRSSNILNHRPKGGFMRFVLGYSAFMMRAVFFASKHLKAGDTLVCIDLETAIPGLVAARLRGVRIHFDIADPFYLTKPVPFKRFFRWLEGFLATRADVVTVPHASRLSLYKSPLRGALIVENVPNLLPIETGSHSFLKNSNGSHRMVFGYFGTLESDRGLEDLMSLVMLHEETYLKIGGRGSLEPLILEAVSLCDRIEFTGAYQPDDLPKLSAEVDVYCSLYYLSKPLHRYAAPNKFFEHLALGKPILMSAGTPYAQDVVASGTGWIVKDGYEALVTWYESMKVDVPAFESAASRAREKWDREYRDWLQVQRSIFLLGCPA